MPLFKTLILLRQIIRPPLRQPAR